MLRAAGVIAAIALLDWRIVGEIPLGFLYLLPMLMVGSVLEPWQIGSVAALCTFLAEVFDDLRWNPPAGISRDVLYFAAFFGAGLFVREVNRNRSAALLHLEEIEQQSEARREAEGQLRMLIESSPAAIFTADAGGTVLMANEAAHRLLDLPSDSLPGQSIHRYFPSLANISRQEITSRLYRTMMQSRGQRADGEVFLAEICFSTYSTQNGSRLAAMILDTSEELRTREETSLQQMLTGSRIAAAAVSHEIRNVSGAISVVHQNLARSGLLSRNKDFEALGNLLQALERIAAVDLRQYTDQTAETDLISVLDDLRIVVSPALREAGIEGRWEIPPELPIVWADRQNLMQVFLNVTSNAIRALASRDRAALFVSAVLGDRSVTVEFADNAGGVRNPDRLFHPFQQEAEVSGLGLFLSRALMRACRGELRYRPLPNGSCFIVEMPVVDPVESLA
ncbi:MAG TPA: PAS domain-containing sensor histidine kinase [Acidobacteriaceae bacterium]|nr:PAS domain-containing sensor histidine kinase [Acidobacteriaceae bacterium]